MAYTEYSTDALRPEWIDKAIKNLIRSRYIFKNLVTQVTAPGWDITYYRETDKDHSAIPGGPPTSPAGVSRGAAFPMAFPAWEAASTAQIKHALQSQFFEEDVLASNVDVRNTSIEVLTDTVAFSVDDTIYTALQSGAAQSFGVPSTQNWNEALASPNVRVPYEHFLRCAALVNGTNRSMRFRADTIVINPAEEPYVLGNQYIMDAFTRAGENIMKNGKLGTLGNMSLISSIAVDAGEFLVMQARVAATWASLKGLQTRVIEDPGIKSSVRAWEYGVCYVKAPFAVVRGTGALE